MTARGESFKDIDEGGCFAAMPEGSDTFGCFARAAAGFAWIAIPITVKDGVVSIVYDMHGRFTWGRFDAYTKCYPLSGLPRQDTTKLLGYLG